MNNEIRKIKLAQNALKSRCAKLGYREQDAVSITDSVVLGGVIFAEFDVCKFKCFKENDQYVIKIVESTQTFKSNFVESLPMKSVLALCTAIEANDRRSRDALESYYDSVSVSSGPMSIEQSSIDSERAATFLTRELTALMPDDFTVRAYIGKTLGDSLNVSIYSVPPNSSNLALLNAVMSIRLMMHLGSSYDKLVPMNKFEFKLIQQSYQSRNAGLKYRKIAGTSPMEAAQKLLAWTKKNKDIMLSVK